MLDRISRRLGGLTCAVILVTASAAAAESLTWKFKNGETLQYVLERKTHNNIDIDGGMQIEMDMQMVLDLNWKVGEVGADGTADVTQLIDRAQLLLSSPIAGTMAYDSKTGQEGEGPIWEQIGPVMTAMVGKPFQFKISSSGRVSDIKLPTELAERLGQPGGRRGAMFGGGMMSEDLIKQMIQEAVLPLPDGPVNSDTKWQQTITSKLANFGVLTTVVDLSYQDKETKDGMDLLKIGTTANVTFEPAEDADEGMELEIGEQSSEGTALFDNKAGRTVESTVVQKMVREMIVREREIIQDEEVTITLRTGVSPEKGIGEAAEEPAPEPPADDKPADETKN